MSCEDDLARAQAALRQEQGYAAALVQERTFVTAERTRLRQEADKVAQQQPGVSDAAYQVASPYSEEGRRARNLPQEQLIELIQASLTAGGAEPPNRFSPMRAVLPLRSLAPLGRRIELERSLCFSLPSLVARRP